MNSIVSITKARQKRKKEPVRHQYNNNKLPICLTESDAKKFGWQFDEGKPNCEDCIKILEKR